MADFKAQVIHLHLRRCWLNLSSSQMGSSKMFRRVKENIISRKTHSATVVVNIILSRTHLGNICVISYQIITSLFCGNMVYLSINNIYNPIKSFLLGFTFDISFLLVVFRSHLSVCACVYLYIYLLPHLFTFIYIQSAICRQ